MRSGSKVSPCPSVMLYRLLLVSVLLQVAWSFVVTDDEGDPTHKQVPTGRAEGPGLWTLVDEPIQPGGIMSYTRLGRKLFKLPQTLIPYPRAGRMLDPGIFDYDMSLVPDYVDCPCLNTLMEGRDKKAAIAFPPGMGRKKRSISDDESEQEDDVKKRQDTFSRVAVPEWRSFEEEFFPDFFLRKDRRPASRSRNSFVPRVGKKRSEDDMEDREDKRAVAFTPRIGRASLIPRIGRNDPRFKVESRGAFIPRIGRRAAFTPRIGRSVGQDSNNEESE